MVVLPLVAIALGLTVVIGGGGALSCTCADWRSFIVVFVGGLTATAAAFPAQVGARLPGALWTAATARLPDLAVLRQQLAHLAKTARCRGVLALEDYARSHPHGLTRRGLQLLVDGTEPEALARTLATQLATAEARRTQDRRLLEVLARNWLVFAVIGVALKLMMPLDAGASGVDLARQGAAPILQGLVLTALFAWPLAGRLGEVHQREGQVCRMVIEALRAIQCGHGEHLVERALNAFVASEGPAGTPVLWPLALQAPAPVGAEDGQTARFAAEHHEQALAALRCMAGRLRDTTSKQQLETLTAAYDRGEVSLVSVLAALGQEAREALLQDLRRAPVPPSGEVAAVTDLDFDDLARLSEQDLATLLRAVAHTDLVPALWGAPGAVRMAFLRGLSGRLRPSIEEELAWVHPHPVAVLAAQARIVALRHRLAQDGQAMQPAAP
jgi:chemotaxis protein MotA